MFDYCSLELRILTICVELIGEEIYDEFDQEGAGGTAISYAPVEHPPFSNHQGNSLPNLPSTVTQPTEALKQTSTNSVLRPRAIKGFGFLRSRSEPPTPREKKQVVTAQPIPEATTPSPTGDKQDVPKIVLQTPEAVTVTDDPQDTPQPAKPRPFEGALPAQGLGKKSFSNASIASSPPISVSAPCTRPSSPAPSLEAILLDRKRRLTAAKELGITPPKPSDVVSPTVNHVPTFTTKVGMFKSSPLTGGERSRIFVPEQEEGATGPTEEKRIPEKKDDDVAHVKKEDDSGYL